MGHYTIRTGKKTGQKIDLESLYGINKRFLEEAFEKLGTNENWVDFEQWAFGLNSPLYKKQNDVTDDPLYRILKDMATRLGIIQGEIDGDIV